MRAIQVTEFGGPEVLMPAVLSDPVPAAHELLIEVSGAGVNFADTHQADNSYLAPSRLPFVPGVEVVGTVVGSSRRVAGLVTRGGGYAELALVNADTALDVPGDLTDAQVLALLVQGLTAWHLLTTSTRMAPGESVVIHAAAGGVGNLAVQLARHLGAGRIIATASTDAKLAQAVELGADVGVRIGPDDQAVDIAAALRAGNDGRALDVVLEMVGGPTFDASLAALARFGRVVTYGLASRRPPQPLHPGQLMVGSHTVAGFWLTDCMTRDRAPSMVVEPLARLVTLVQDGVLHPLAGPTYQLADARRAHEDMRARRTTGKVVLDPRAGR